jgi:hypothetical protein
MSLYKRGGVWWYKFKFNNATIRESSGVTNKEAARAVEDARHDALRNAAAGYKRRKPPALSKNDPVVFD